MKRVIIIEDTDDGFSVTSIGNYTEEEHDQGVTKTKASAIADTLLVMLNSMMTKTGYSFEVIALSTESNHAVKH